VNNTRQSSKMAFSFSFDSTLVAPVRMGTAEQNVRGRELLKEEGERMRRQIGRSRGKA